MSRREVDEPFYTVRLRRSGGGGDNPPVVVALGLMLMALALMAVLFKKCKQSNMIACILIGGMVGYLKLDERWELSREAMNAFVELSIVMVLFMGGLELDIEAVQTNAKLVLINGFGQIVSHWFLFTAIGALTGLVEGLASTVVFGLVLTFSSTILVLGALKQRGEMESMHGQIILGLMMLQDVLAVLALCIVPAFEVVDNPADHVDVGKEIAIVLAVMAGVIFVLYFLAKYVFDKVFHFYAMDGEMLFIGTMGFSVGVAGICASISPNVAGLGAFFSGIAMSSLPYKIEIEKKCEPLRAFGITIFFIMLGIDLDLDPAALLLALPYALLISFVTVVISPCIMWALGYLSGIKARTAFFNGLIINQISEFGLILSQAAHGIGLFKEEVYHVITLSLLITLFLSSIGHLQVMVPNDSFCRASNFKGYTA